MILLLIPAFALATIVLGAACAPHDGARPALRLVAGMAYAIGCWFGGGFVLFAAGVGNGAAAGILSLLALAFVVIRRRSARNVLAAGDVRAMLGAWVLFSAWSLGLLALVVTYSGGGWAVDWLEHWQRTEFFAARQPLDTLFAGRYALTARPPLVNLVVALWLESSGPTFPAFQVAMTLFGSLVLLPAWVLAETWRPRAGHWVVLLLMLNPLVAQNVTFAWTKLPTAFFVLTALALGFAQPDWTAARTRRLGAAVCLGLAFLSHFSAGPWIVAFLAAWLFVNRTGWREPALWRHAAGIVALLAGVVALWAGWAAWRFGWEGTAATNTTATAWQAQSAPEKLLVPLRNVADTVVPFPLRGEPGDGLIVQASRLGRVRDVAFNVYQVNLLLSFGAAGLWVLLSAAARFRRSADAPSTVRFHQVAIPIAIVLGILVHTPRDEWGLAHICLQPLVLLGLVAGAVGLTSAAPSMRLVWGGLAAIDVVFGIALHFAIQSWAAAPVIAPGGTGADYVRSLSIAAVANARDKWKHGLEFFADLVPAPPWMLGLWLALLAGFVILRLRRSDGPAH